MQCVVSSLLPAPPPHACPPPCSCLQESSDVDVSTAGKSPSATTSQNWRAMSDSTRLLNVLVLAKDDFINRNRKPSREQLDAGHRKLFWDDAAELFNGKNRDLEKFEGDAEKWRTMGLSCQPSGYLATAEKLEAVFKELRKDHMTAQKGFRQSGNGEGGPVDVEDSLTIHSAFFKDFVNTKPVDEYFYEILLAHGLLESAATDMPAGSTSSSTELGTTAKKDKRSSSSSSSPQSAVKLTGADVSTPASKDKNNTAILKSFVLNQTTSPNTKAAESNATKFMAQKQKASLKRELLSLSKDQEGHAGALETKYDQMSDSDDKKPAAKKALKKAKKAAAKTSKEYSKLLSDSSGSSDSESE